MAISKKLGDAINEQINKEFYSAYLYLSMASYFEDKNLGGFSNWMRLHYMEETSHGMKFFNYLVERGGRVLLSNIEAPSVDWKSSLDVFKQTYLHEQDVTASINDLVKLAREENDYATESFLMWYVDEQVEEEATVKGILEKLEMVQNSPNGIFMIDQELGSEALGATVVPIILNQKI